MNDTKISKTLSYYLRHGAIKEKVDIDTNGYVRVNDLLKRDKLENVKLADIERVVEQNEKQRFELNGEFIRARQGHTISTIEDAGFTDIKSVQYDDRYAIHATYIELLHKLQCSPGISRMQRQHIHMTTPQAVFNPEAGAPTVVRYDADLFIWIDLQQVLALGLPLMRSSNNVILCPGDANGFIPWSCVNCCTNRQQKKIPLAIK